MARQTLRQEEKIARNVARRREKEQARQRLKMGARGPSGLKRLLVFGAVAVAVLSAVAYFLWPAVKPAGPATPGVITVQPSMGGFSPSYIAARVGEPITVRLVNKDDQFHTDGGGWHQFAIDRLGVDVKVPPSTTKEFTFTPTESGTFGFYCSVCCGGKENPYMWGTLEVQA